MFRQSEVLSSSLPSRAKIVYVYLCDRANKDGYCWPSQKLIAEELNISIDTVNRAVNDLRKAGYIRTYQRLRQSGAWSSLLYELSK